MNMSTQSIQKLTQANFSEQVLGVPGPVVVDFWAEWCGPCKMIAPLLDEIAREMPGKVKIVKINVDHEQQLAQQYGIYNIPTLLFFKGGQVLEQVVGTAAKKVLVEKINSHA
jgi:thioredoxin 1